MPKKNRWYGENSSCRDSQEHTQKKEKSNTFNSRIIKLSQSSCLYLAIEEITQMCKVQKKKVTQDLVAHLGGDRENKEDVRRTTNDPWLLLKVYFSRILLTKLSGFAKFECSTIISDQTSMIHRVVSVWLLKISVFPLDSVKKKSLCLTDRGYELPHQILASNSRIWD